jgi:hypothetical protein
MFLSRIFVVPSIILVVLAYLTFWIDSSKPSARVIFSVTLILKAIALMTSTRDYIPLVNQPTWLQEFLLWNLIFTVFPLLEYAILNAAKVSYKWRQTEIKNLINEVKALASKTDEPDKPS